MKIAQHRQEENKFCGFGLWLMAGKNGEFIAQYFPDNRSLGEVYVDFSCNVYLTPIHD